MRSANRRGEPRADNGSAGHLALAFVVTELFEPISGFPVHGADGASPFCSRADALNRPDAKSFARLRAREAGVVECAQFPR